MKLYTVYLPNLRIFISLMSRRNNWDLICDTSQVCMYIFFPCAPLEELPVRLWEQERGESCLGYLDVTLKGKWEPVCQREVDSEADSSAADATAEVVCRELGCGHVLKWERLLDDRRLFTQTVGGIRCIGKEKKIKDCPVEQIEDCKQRGMLYIVCSGETV